MSKFLKILLLLSTANISVASLQPTTPTKPTASLISLGKQDNMDCEYSTPQIPTCLEDIQKIEAKLSWYKQIYRGSLVDKQINILDLMQKLLELLKRAGELKGKTEDLYIDTAVLQEKLKKRIKNSSSDIDDFIKTLTSAIKTLANNIKS